MCQTLIVAFALFGVALLGVPLAFLQPYSTPLLVISAVLILWSLWTCTKHGMSPKALLKPVGFGLLAAVLILFVLLVALPPETADVSPQPSKCAPAAGYTPEQWREHVSHHPLLYEECLNEERR
ncbi:MAG: hypothetical protein HY366_01740 [Candidatus Aenigmarchaeota archaeon]|nr:hypothetical protein [Candidatus Aenigmarchaeota archaeon]